MQYGFQVRNILGGYRLLPKEWKMNEKKIVEQPKAVTTLKKPKRNDGSFEFNRAFLSRTFDEIKMEEAWS